MRYGAGMRASMAMASLMVGSLGFGTMIIGGDGHYVRPKRVPPAEPVGPMFDPPKETRQMRRQRERQEAKRGRHE